MINTKSLRMSVAIFLWIFLDVLTRKHQTHRTINGNCMQKVNKIRFYIYLKNTVGIPLWRKRAACVCVCVCREPFVGSEYVGTLKGGRMTRTCTRATEMEIRTANEANELKREIQMLSTRCSRATTGNSMRRDDIRWPEL